MAGRVLKIFYFGSLYAAPVRNSFVFRVSYFSRLATESYCSYDDGGSLLAVERGRAQHAIQSLSLHILLNKESETEKGAWLITR